MQPSQNVKKKWVLLGMVSIRCESVGLDLFILSDRCGLFSVYSAINKLCYLLRQIGFVVLLECGVTKLLVSI
jgi:hypothetical protein